MTSSTRSGVRPQFTTRADKSSATTFGRWTVVEPCGSDDWMRYYLIRSSEVTSSGANFLLKVARNDLPSHDGSEFARAILAREATVCRAVRHRHLADIVAYDARGDAAWIVQPLYAGPTLYEALSVPIPLPQLLWIARQIAEALSTLHAAGWLHGHLTSDAVYLAASGHITLAELGFARRLDSEECDVASAAFYGSLTHAAPEMFSREGRTEATADIYSLGVLLFEGLTGRTLFPDYKGAQLLAAKRMVAPPDVRSLRPAISFGAAELVRRMLSREPLRRPTAAEVVDQLAVLEIEAFASWKA